MSKQISVSATPLSIDGALVLDKPSGVSSAKYIARIKRRFPSLKVGHAGTLDPAASGVLIVLLGKATRLQDLFLNSGKRYAGEFKLGITSASDDLETEVTQHCQIGEFWKTNFSTVSLEQIAADLQSKFSGKLLQKPPSYSAVSKHGVRSYKAARKGKTLELTARQVEVEFHKLSFASEDTLAYDLSVSKGTYVRSLARDIGEHLGCGGVAGSIRRLSSGRFSLEDAVSLEDEFSADFLLESVVAMEDLASLLPELRLSDAEIHELYQGRRGVLDTLTEEPPGALRAVFSEQGRFSGLLEVKKEAGWAVRFLMGPVP